MGIGNVSGHMRGPRSFRCGASPFQPTTSTSQVVQWIVLRGFGTYKVVNACRSCLGTQGQLFQFHFRATAVCLSLQVMTKRQEYTTLRHSLANKHWLATSV